MALIIALILVALAAILATKLTFDGWLERRRTIGIMAAEQALHFGMGAEALAADVLSQSAGVQAPTATRERQPTGKPDPRPAPQQVTSRSLGTAHSAPAHHARG